MLPRALRHRLKALAAPLRVRVRNGPLRGLAWSVATGLPFVRGAYEPRKADALAALVQPGAVVYDVGAHVGYFAAMAARAAGSGGRVVAFEPRPLNLGLLGRHIEWNRLETVQVFQAAVGERAGAGRFRDDRGTGTGFLTDEERGLQVAVVTLDGLVVEERLPPPNVIKVDVEGGEVAVLRGAAYILEEFRPFLLLATHGPGTHEPTLEILEGHGYRWTLLDDRRTDSDTEMVAWPTEAEPPAF